MKKSIIKIDFYHSILKKEKNMKKRNKNKRKKLNLVNIIKVSIN